MPDYEDVIEMKKRVQLLQSQADKAAGRLEELQAQLQGEFECDTLEDGEALLVTLREQEADAKADLDDVWEEFSTKWADVVQEIV